VVALEQDLAATANTHQLVTEFVEAVAGAEKNEDGAAEQGALKGSADGRFWCRHHYLFGSRDESKRIAASLRNSVSNFRVYPAVPCRGFKFRPFRDWDARL